MSLLRSLHLCRLTRVFDQVFRFHLPLFLRFMMCADLNRVPLLLNVPLPGRLANELCFYQAFQRDFASHEALHFGQRRLSGFF